MKAQINTIRHFQGSFFKKNGNYILVFLTIAVSFIPFHLASLFHNEFSRAMSIASYLTWHNLFEFSGVLVSFAVFLVTYYTYDQTKNIRSLFLGYIFLMIGIIDTFHTLSFKGMPDFFVPCDDANRPTTFWIISRLIGGIGFIVAAFIPIDKKSGLKKRFMLIPVLAICGVIFVVVTYYHELIPHMYIEGAGLTNTKKNLEYVIIFMFIVAIIKRFHEYGKTKNTIVIMFSCALVLNIYCELAFVSYNSVYDVYNYLGHVFKFFSCFLMFRALFIFNIQKPYMELSMAKDELKDYAENLDRLVDQRTKELKNMNQKLMEDLEYAKDVQRALLPSGLPQDKCVEFDAGYYPAERVSGDFYNVFRLDENNIGVYIGDVSGHGVPAAMLTVFLNQTIKPINYFADSKHEIASPSSVLHNVYKSFNNTNFKDDIYMVLLYGIFNTRTREFTYASAGMNVLPLLIDCNGKVSEIEVKGFPICRFIEYYTANYTDEKMNLRPGDKIFFYTDGLIDAENENRQTYSEERLIKLLQDTGSVPASELTCKITGDVFDFVGKNQLKDDITFIVMQVN